MEVRPIDCLHLDAVVRIAEESFPRPWQAKDFAYFLAHDFRLTLGLFEGGKLQAYFLALLVQGDLDVISLATRRESRRKGYGEILLRAALGDRDVARAFLEVDVENAAAIALYRKLGFTVLGTRKGYYDRERDAYAMRWGPAAT